MPRSAHTPPRVKAAVLNRLYQEPLSLEDAVQLIAAGGAPSPAGAPATAPPQAADNAAVQMAAPPRLALALPGDPRAFSQHFLRRTVVAVSRDAPRLQGQQLRLSQRSTQEQVPASSPASPPATSAPHLRPALPRSP
jgi:hypothetical protein